MSSFQRGASDDDAPEPRLAMLGPPAITRLMFELWQTDPRLKARFDLRNPLHRRGFVLWLQREGRFLGIGDKSIAAAAAILRKGTTLHGVGLLWPSQAALAMPPAKASVDAWLAEPITLEFEAPARGIPLPRVLALLWELRQDVRLHFPNRSGADLLNYLTWCLTQGIRDGCVPVPLTAPVLAGFLDTPDPGGVGQVALGSGPPITRLLRMMAPLYDGPHPEIARQFPATRQSRIGMAIWACGTLRRRFGWPKSFVERPLHWLTAMAPHTADAFLPLDNLVLGLWEICADVRARCDLHTHEGRAALLQWFIHRGLREYELEDCLSDRLAARVQPLRYRESHRRRAVAGDPTVRRDLCLVGYSELVSGRAEDLRMSALALRRLRRAHAVLDRLSGAITTEEGRAAALAGRPRINLVHLNGDTAFFDYLFLRDRGIERGYTIGYWAWELAKFPEDWKSSFAFVQEVWAASRFAYDAIAPAAAQPVVLMPMAVAVPAPEPGLKRSDFGLPDDKFVFYFSFDFRSFASRKNPLAAVAAFRQAFPGRNAPALLLLKTIGSDWRADGRDSLIEAIRGDPRIVLFDHELARPRAIALLALSDCFVSLHRAEGFGRGPAEAMLLGKPVIVTDYSGTRDFATRETALVVNYRLVPVEAEQYPGWRGQFWAEADIDHAAAAMRAIAGDRALAERLGNTGRARIRELYDPSVIGARYLERLEAIARAL